jgi:hypothetical protein
MNLIRLCYCESVFEGKSTQLFLFPIKDIQKSRNGQHLLCDLTTVGSNTLNRLSKDTSDMLLAVPFIHLTPRRQDKSITF